MKRHALWTLEARLRTATAPRPPDLTGSKMNQTRRRQLLDHWWASRYGLGNHRRAPAYRIAPHDADRLALGKFYPWIVASRAEEAATLRTRKAQLALQAAARARRTP